MNIGIITYDYDPPIGGLGRSVKRVTNMLKKIAPRDRFVVIAPSPQGRDVHTFAPMTRLMRGGCPLFSLALHVHINILIKRYSLERIIVHSGSGGAFLLVKPRSPLIVISHHSYRQEASYVFRAKRIKRWWKRCMAMLERRTYSIADAIICVSNDTKEELIQHYAVPAHKIQVVENSIDSKWFERGENVIKQKRTLFYFGRIEERKGIWVLLDAFVAVHRTHPEVRLRLIGNNLAGDALQAFIHRQGIASVVDIVEHLEDSAFKKEMRSAEIIVIPSLVEGFGLTAAEAMACGALVIVSNCAGLRHVITHEKTGLHFESGNSASCADAILRAIQSGENGNKWRANAAEEAATRFTEERQAREVMAVIGNCSRNSI